MEPSEWRKAGFYDEAVLTLSAALGRSLEETEALVREYIAEKHSAGVGRRTL